jgi:shikimate kinase
MNLKLKRTPGIYLVGFMGSGKTTIGRMYAEEIGWRFADLDDDIEAEQGTTISDLFERHGEAAFRKIESEALQKRVQSIRRGIPTVLALGGGAFTVEENIDLATENGTSVWLDAELAIVKKRVAMADHRPLARDQARFERLYRERKRFYRRAEYHIRITDDDSRAALQLLRALQLLD